MKNLYLKAIGFIRENPSLIFSLVLVAIVPAAFFANTFLISRDFEQDIDSITQVHAVNVENIIKYTASKNINDVAALQETIDSITMENEKIIEINILRPKDNVEDFEVTASNIGEFIGQSSNSIQDRLAWDDPQGIAFLGQNDSGRFWKVTKHFTDPDGKKLALVSISFSLNDTDQLINETINRAYMILAITILVVILFVSNQARLFGYALTVSKLKEVDQMKDMFISMASHELRTPLTTIKGYAELLEEKKDIAADEETSHYVKNISLSIDRLQNLVSDILEVSRIEGNRLPVEISKVDPAPIILSTFEELKNQALKKHLAFTYSPFKDPLHIMADPERFKQILVNLIGNSIKYTLKGSVDISTSVKDDNFLVTIADTGIGISSENMANLFKKFYRVQSDETKSISGTGLGLWITQELAKKMNGKITVESIEGVGSHFTIYLPLAK